jgi:hypothetical protein
MDIQATYSTDDACEVTALSTWASVIGRDIVVPSIFIRHFNQGKRFKICTPLVFPLFTINEGFC